MFYKCEIKKLATRIIDNEMIQSQIDFMNGKRKDFYTFGTGKQC